MCDVVHKISRNEAPRKLARTDEVSVRVLLRCKSQDVGTKRDLTGSVDDVGSWGKADLALARPNF